MLRRLLFGIHPKLPKCISEMFRVRAFGHRVTADKTKVVSLKRADLYTNTLTLFQIVWHSSATHQRGGETPDGCVFIGSLLTRTYKHWVGTPVLYQSGPSRSNLSLPLLMMSLLSSFLPAHEEETVAHKAAITSHLTLPRRCQTAPLSDWADAFLSIAKIFSVKSEAGSREAVSGTSLCIHNTPWQSMESQSNK